MARFLLSIALAFCWWDSGDAMLMSRRRLHGESPFGPYKLKKSSDDAVTWYRESMDNEIQTLAMMNGYHREHPDTTPTGTTDTAGGTSGTGKPAIRKTGKLISDGGKKYFQETGKTDKKEINTSNPDKPLGDKEGLVYQKKADSGDDVSVTNKPDDVAADDTKIGQVDDIGGEGDLLGAITDPTPSSPTPSTPSTPTPSTPSTPTKTYETGRLCIVKSFPGIKGVQDCGATCNNDDPQGLWYRIDESNRDEASVPDEEKEIVYGPEPDGPYYIVKSGKFEWGTKRSLVLGTVEEHNETLGKAQDAMDDLGGLLTGAITDDK